MRNFAALGLLGAAALVGASDVHELKTDTFKGFVEENDLVLAECEWAASMFIIICAMISLLP